MHILADARWFGESGIGRYANEVLKRKPDNIQISYLIRSWKIKNPVTPWLLGAAANISTADLFWSPGFMPPAKCRLPFAVTVHDLIHLHHGTPLHGIYYNQVIRPLLCKAVRVLTVSEYSRKEIVEWAGLSPDRVVAIHNGVDTEFSPDGDVFSPGFPYVLYIGNRRKYKNLGRLIQAFRKGALDSNIRLAFSGPWDQELISLAKKYEIADRLVFLGQIEEVVLPSVYRGALAVAYVSLYEGFGLPPLEAMACGTPVLTSNVTSLPEVVGDAALLVNPYDVEAIADGLKRLVEDSSLRNELRRKGLERAKQFSWDKTAELTWRVIKEASQR